MTDETTKQTDNLLDAGWLSQLPEAYRPIAQRYGKDEFIIAYAIGSITEALGVINNFSRNNSTAKKAVFFIQSGANNLATYAMLGKGMTTLKIKEIQLDIERAAALSNATQQDEKGRIIVPS